MATLATLTLLLASGLVSQEQNPLVTAEVRAASAPVAIAELSRQINVPLEAMPSTKEDVLILKVNQVPLKVLMQKIADTLGAEWEQTANGHRLIRNEQIRRKEIQGEQERLTSRLSKDIQERKKELDSEADLTSQSAEAKFNQLADAMKRDREGQDVDWSDLVIDTPTDRLLGQMLCDLGPAFLASLPEESYVTFSNRPNRMQKAIPANINPYLQSFLARQSIWALAHKAAKQRHKNLAGLYVEEEKDPSSYRVGKVLLKLRRTRTINAHLTLLDTNGKYIGSARETLGSGWKPKEERSEGDQGNTKEEPIVFTGLSKEVYDRFYGEGPTLPPPSKEFQAFLLNPEKNEPLSLMATDSLFAVGQAKKLNVVACPTDEMIYLFGEDSDEATVPSSYLRGLEIEGLDIQIDQDWLTVKSARPSYSRSVRTNRGLLGSCIRRAVQEDALTLENAAAYAFAHNTLREQTAILYTYLDLFGLDAPYEASWDGLRLYGSLLSAQLRTGQANQQIAFRSLSTNQREIVRQMVFEQGFSPLYKEPLEGAKPEEEEEDDLGEVTEDLPNGFSGNEILTIQESTAPQLYGSPDPQANSRVKNAPITAADIAYNLLVKERFEMLSEERRKWYPPYTQFKQGVTRTIEMSLQFGNRVSTNEEMIDQKPPAGGWIPFTSLPEEIKKEVAKALEELKNRPPQTRGGGKLPPPRP